MEIWKDIKGYEGIYQASSYGRIKSVEDKTTHSNRHGVRKWKERILKTRGHNKVTGNRVTLWKDKKPKDFLTARLVAFTFLGGDIKDRWLTVNHKDLNRFNNHIDNLELISISDNIKHARENGVYDKYQRKTKLINKRTGKIITFVSIAEANRFLGKNHSYINSKLNRGINENEDYIFVVS